MWNDFFEIQGQDCTGCPGYGCFCKGTKGLTGERGIHGQEGPEGSIINKMKTFDTDYDKMMTNLS